LRQRLLQAELDVIVDRRNFLLTVGYVLRNYRRMQQKPHPVRAYRHGQSPRVSLSELARRLGTSKTTLSQIENGSRPVSLELLPKLRAETGIPGYVLRPDLAEILEPAVK
jgi:transcriptional regulator with XRE-family HTH domain